MRSHQYDVEVDDARVAFLLGEIPKPWHSEAVLKHLHHEEEMSFAAIGRLFDRDRRTIQEIASEFGIEVRYHGKENIEEVEEDQRTLDAYEREEEDIEEMDGLGDLV